MLSAGAYRLAGPPLLATGIAAHALLLNLQQKLPPEPICLQLGCLDAEPRQEFLFKWLTGERGVFRGRGLRSRLGQGNKARQGYGLSWRPATWPLEKALKDKLHHRINLILSQRVGEGRVCCPGLLRSHLAQGNSSGKETVFLCGSKKYCYTFSVQTSTNPESLHS